MRATDVKFRSSPVEITAGVNKGAWGVYMEDPDCISMNFSNRRVIPDPINRERGD